MVVEGNNDAESLIFHVPAQQERVLFAKRTDFRQLSHIWVWPLSVKSEDRISGPVFSARLTKTFLSFQHCLRQCCRNACLV